MKQTAVEWLWDMLLKGEFINNPEELFERAKQMEKEQIIEAHNHGFTEGTCFGASPISYTFIKSEEYYNETFKQQKP